MIKKEIEDKELNEFLQTLEEDKLRIFTMAEGRVRGALFHGTRFVNQLRAQHNLGILETYILGQASLCGALTIPMMKDMEHTAIKFEGNGPAQGYSVEASSTGFVRSFLFNEHIQLDKPLESWDLNPFLGQGTITFSRIHKDDKYPQSSTVEVNSGNIATDFATYFAQSEQINTAFNSSIQFDKQGRVIGAGAMYLQIMPKTGGTAKVGSQVDSHAEETAEDEDLLRRVENAFKACPSLGLLYSEKQVDSEDIIIGLFREFSPTISLTRDVIFDCKCNEEYYINYLRTLPKEQIEDIKKNGPDPLEIICRNCGSIYKIPVEKI
ncbi:MAG: Hsp33 family molecular chaperone HslO [Treponema sp.]|nr:Hsp33 family molecular chaperone HslO [Treponema sp.]MBQ8212052.1 Hsp33 family molecular chaperone HslO [Treponema sp.]MBQ8776190.1 Hsp33 family molecular chaperone HslO [Treponema sp.]